MAVSRINELLVAAVGYAHNILHRRFQTGSPTFCDRLECVVISVAAARIITSDGPGCGDSRQTRAQARGLYIISQVDQLLDLRRDRVYMYNEDVGIEVLSARVLVKEVRFVEQRTSLTTSHRFL